MPRKPATAGKSRSRERLKEHVSRVVEALEHLYPDSRCALVYRNPYQLLVATILSAQCTDVRVNMVTPALFARYPDAKSLADSEQADVEEFIRTTGLYRSKAKNLRAMAAEVVELHGGEVPADLDALTRLAGVGRKTANVVLGNAFNIASGFVVDTHVKRLAFRLGLTENTDPIKIERDLIGLIDPKHWVNLSHRLIEHGRKVCVARKPRCSVCELAALCPRNGVESHT